MRNLYRRMAIGSGAVAVAAAVAVLPVSPASAHVTVNPGEVAQGSFARLDFRVPNEQPDASTVTVEVNFPDPAEAVIPSVSVAPVPGWQVEVASRTLDEPVEGGHGDEITEVVETVTWTADNDDAAVQPGQFLEFPVSIGPVPENVDAIYFPTFQTYSSDEVVEWIDVPAGDAEPEYPAPALELVAAESGEDDGGAAGTGDSEEAAGSSDDDSGGGAALVLAIVGIVAGLAGVGVGAFALTRTRRA